MLRPSSRRGSGAPAGQTGSWERSLAATVTAEMVDTKVEAVKAELRLDMAEAVSGLTAALTEQGAAFRIAIEKQGAAFRIAIEKQNATIEKQNAAIEKQGAQLTAAIKELGAEVRIAIEKQNATIEKQNAAIEKQGAEMTAALAQYSSDLDQRLTTAPTGCSGWQRQDIWYSSAQRWSSSVSWRPPDPRSRREDGALNDKGPARPPAG